MNLLNSLILLLFIVGLAIGKDDEKTTQNEEGGEGANSATSSDSDSENDSDSPKTLKALIEKYNLTKVFGARGKELREREIEGNVENISSGKNAYQKIEFFGKILKGDPGTIKSVTEGKNDGELKKEILKVAAERTEEERRALVDAIEKDGIKRKMGVLKRAMKMEDKAEEEEYVKTHFKVYERQNPGFFRKAKNQQKWEEERQAFVKKFEEYRRGHPEADDKTALRALAKAMISEEEVKNMAQKFVDETKEERHQLVEAFMKWIGEDDVEEREVPGEEGEASSKVEDGQEEGDEAKKEAAYKAKLAIRKKTKKIVYKKEDKLAALTNNANGGDEGRRKLIRRFIEWLQRTNLLAKIAAKAAFGMGIDQEYLDKLAPKDSYMLPPDIQGLVVELGDKLRSTNQGIDAMLLYVQAKLAKEKGTDYDKLEEVKEQMVEMGKREKGKEEVKGEDGKEKNKREKRDVGTHRAGSCHMSLRVGRRMRGMAFLFDQAVSIPQPRIEEFLERHKSNKDRDVESGTGISREELEAFLKKQRGEEEEEKGEEEEEEEDDDEQYTQITTYTLLEVIQKGEKVFGPNRELSWTTLEPVENKLKSKNWWAPVTRALALILKKFGEFFGEVRKLFDPIMKGADNFGKNVQNLFDGIAKIFGRKKEELLKEMLPLKPQITEQAEKYLKQMQEAQFIENHEPLEKLRAHRADVFDFLRQVRYQIEVMPGDTLDPRDPLATKITQHLENPLEGGHQFTEEQQAYFDRNRDGNMWRGKHIGDYQKGDGKKEAVCEQLKTIVQQVLYPKEEEEGKNVQLEPAHREMQGRLGANILMSIMNTKSITQELLVGLALSFVGSGGIALVMDVILLGLINLLLTALGPITGGISIALIIPVSIIIPSLTPLLAETFDSFIIKRLMGLNRGKPFWPKNNKELEKNLKEALLAGSIAAAGSVPYNVLGGLAMFSGWAFLPVKAIANFIGTATSAAMVPLEIENMGGHTGASIIMKMEDGFLAKPNSEEIVQKYMEKKNAKWAKGKHSTTLKETAQADSETLALRKYIKEKTERVLRIAKASAQAISSMGTGATIGFLFGFLFFAIPHELGWISESTMEVGSIAFNSPTEAISMTAQSMTGEGVGQGADGKAPQPENEFSRKWLSRDSTKNAQMMQLVFLRTMEQLESNHNAVVPIGYNQIHGVFRPILTFTSPFGEWIVNRMRKIFFKAGLAEDLKKDLDVKNLKNRVHNNVAQSGIAEEAEIIVENWRQDLVYLVQRPRTSTSPGLAPNDLAMETWLKFRKTPFYRLTNARFLNALFGEQLPLIELNGEQIFGSIEQMIAKLDEKLGKSTAVVLDLSENEELEKEEKSFRKIINKIINRVLLYDRQHGVNFVLKDAGIEKQLKEEHVPFENHKHTIKTVSGPKEVPLTGSFWREFLDNAEGIVQLGHYDWNGGVLHQTPGDVRLWPTFLAHLPRELNAMWPKAHEQWGAKTLRGATNMMKLRLKINRVESDEPNAAAHITFDELKPDQMFALFKKAMKKIENQLMRSYNEHHGGHHGGHEGGEAERKFYLFGKQPTPADALLFAHLVQFLETHTLNNGQLKSYFVRIVTDPNNIFHKYVDQIKKHDWGLDGEHMTWEQLKAEPWAKLNYDWNLGAQKVKADKFDEEDHVPFGLLADDIEPADAANVSPFQNDIDGQHETKEVAAAKSGQDDFPLEEPEEELVASEGELALELATFAHLPLPKDGQELARIGAGTDRRMVHWYSPTMRHLLRTLAQIGRTRGQDAFETAKRYQNLKQIPEEVARQKMAAKMVRFREQHNLVAIVEKMRGDCGKQKQQQKHGSTSGGKGRGGGGGCDPNEQDIHVTRALFHFMAAYLCKNDHKNGAKHHNDGDDVGDDHCGKEHRALAHKEMAKISAQAASQAKALESQLKVVTWEEIFRFNEKGVNRQLRTLGSSLIRHLDNADAKINSWLNPRPQSWANKQWNSVRNAIWIKILEMAGIKKEQAEKIFQQHQQGEEEAGINAGGE